MTLYCIRRPVIAAAMVLAAMLGAVGMPARGADAAEACTEQIAVRLLAERDAVQPGRPLQLGLHQRIAPHWHTYWRNPGDAGLATQVTWTLPAGATASEIEWPAPQRFQLGTVVNQGYADEVTLLTTVQVPASQPVGRPFEVKAQVAWLVCRDTCIPQSATLVLALPVQAGAPAPGADAALLQAARARLPQPAPWSVQWRREGDRLKLAWPAGPAPTDSQFFPMAAGPVALAVPQRWTREGDRAVLVLGLGDAAPAADAVLDGVLVSAHGTPHGPQTWHAWQLSAHPDPGAAGRPAVEHRAVARAAGGEALGVALLLALAGGLVLNLMPCVFPVLSIKALSLLQQAQVSRREALAHGMSYTFGVVASFLLLAGTLVALQAGGARVGWGFQFQSPAFVLALAWLMLGVGLNLSGVFALGGGLAGMGQGLAARNGWVGSFFTGVLATVVATPCTAPFMGTAVGWALGQPPLATLAVFATLGLGLALPYWVLSAWPGLQRRLPRPGAWMDRLKQALAFPMYGAAAWLVWVLSQQAGTPSVAVALAGGVLLAFAAWLYGSSRAARPIGRRCGAVAAAAVLLALPALAVGPWAGGVDAPSSAAERSQADRWQPYSPERLQALRAAGRPVFVNLTAAWCLTCLVNERVALQQRSVQAAFDGAGVVALKGDWTQRDERITALLAEHGRRGVPLYLFYPPGRDTAPTVLPQLLTADAVVNAVTSAGAALPSVLAARSTVTAR